MMRKEKPNRKPLIVVADSEAQTAWNDSKLSDRIELEIKKRCNELKHEMLYDDMNINDRLEYHHLQKVVAEKSLQLCNTMNTYLLGYAELHNNKTDLAWYDKREKAFGRDKAQDDWTNKWVKYWFCPDPRDEPWEHMLDDMVKNYREKIAVGKKYRLTIFFHNVDYDAQNLIQHIKDQDFNYSFGSVSLLHNASLYSLSFNYRGCCFELRDSMKIYNQSLAKLGKNVNWKKKTEDATYTWIDLNKQTEKVSHETYYFKHDISVLAAIMRAHVKKFPGKLRLTAASYAEADLKKMVLESDRQNHTNDYAVLFKPKFTDEQENYLRRGYFGGFVYANYKLLNQTLHNGLVGDVNSLYPSVMLNRDYPKWQTVRFLKAEEFWKLDLHDYHTYVVATIKVTKLKIKPDGIPCFPKKDAYGMSREIYDINDLSSDIATLTNFDLYWIGKNYEFKYQYIQGVRAYEWSVRPFKSFILKHKAEKEKASREHNEVDRMVAKIHLNSTYGKFAQRQITTKSVLVKNANGSIGFSEVDDPAAKPRQHNILIAVFVTAFARDVLFSMIEILKSEPDAEFWYADTDAVHFGYKGDLDIVKDDEKIFQELHIPFSKDVFGKWKPEQHMRVARYLGSKRYWEQDPTLEAKYLVDCKKHKKTPNRLDQIAAGAIIKGAGIQKRGKKYLVKQGIEKFKYSKDKPIIVPFRVSKKVVNGVKIYDSTKLIEPTPAQRLVMNLK